LTLGLSSEIWRLIIRLSDFVCQEKSLRQSKISLSRIDADSAWVLPGHIYCNALFGNELGASFSARIDFRPVRMMLWEIWFNPANAEAGMLCFSQELP
jgi:hypothetical protein